MLRGIFGGTAPALKYDAVQTIYRVHCFVQPKMNTMLRHYYNLHFSKSKKRKKTTILPKKPGNDYRDRPYVNKEHKHARAK